MKQFTPVARVFLGDQDLLITSAETVSLLDTPEDGLALVFGVPSLNMSVPGVSVDMIGQGSSGGESSVSLSTESFDAIEYIKSGGSLIYKKAEIRLICDEQYYSYAHVAYRGIISNIDVDLESAQVTMSISPAFLQVDNSFPERTVGDDGRFPDSPEGTRGRAIPVIYGDVKRVPVPAVSISDGIARIALSGHLIYGSKEKPGFVQIGTNPDGDKVDYYPIQEGSDGLGGFYSFIEIPFDEWDDSIYVVGTLGKISSSGSPILKLGDSLSDIWASYANADEDLFDSARAVSANRHLNSIRVGLAITDSSQSQSVIDIVAGRFSNMPVRLNYDRGVFSWDAAFWPARSSWSGKSLIYGVNAMQRSSIAHTPISEVRNRFRFKMSYDAKFNESSETRIVDSSNHALLKVSESIFGRTPILEVDLTDATDKQGAGIAIENIVRSKSAPRMSVTYSGMSAEYLDSKLGELWKMDDPESGLNKSEFVLSSIVYEMEMGTCSLSFISLDDFNTTLRKGEELPIFEITSEPAEESEGGDGQQPGFDMSRYGVYLKVMSNVDQTAAEFKAASYIGIRTSYTNSGDLSDRGGYDIILNNSATDWNVLDPHPGHPMEGDSGGVIAVDHPYAQRQYLTASRIPWEFSYQTVVKGNKDYVLPGMEVFPLDENFARSPIYSTKFQVYGYMKLNHSVVGIINGTAKNPSHRTDDKIGYGTLNLTGREGTFYHYPRTINNVENVIRYFDRGHNIIWRNHPGMWPLERLDGLRQGLTGVWLPTFESQDRELSNRIMITRDVEYFTDTTSGGKNNKKFLGLEDHDIWRNDWYGLDIYDMDNDDLNDLANLGYAAGGSSAVTGSQTAAAAVSGSTYTGSISYFDSIGPRGFITDAVLSRLGVSLSDLTGTGTLRTRRSPMQLLKFDDTTFVDDRFNYPQHFPYIGTPFAQNNKKYIIQDGDTDTLYYVAAKLEDTTSTSERYWLFVTQIFHDQKIDGSESMEIRSPTGSNAETITATDSIDGYVISAHISDFTNVFYSSIVEGTTVLTDSNQNDWLVQKKESTQTGASNAYYFNHVFVTPVGHSAEPGSFSWT